MGNPLRVLHVVVNMNRGGAETLLMNLYRNIDRSKVQFDFLTCKEGMFDQEIRNFGGRVHRIPYVSDVGHHGFIRQLEQFFRNHSEYKIIHSHLDKVSGIVLKTAKKAHVPIRISHSHNTKSEGSLLTKIYKQYAGLLVHNNATHRYACSQAAANWLFKQNNTYILKNGIELDKFYYNLSIRTRVRKELQISEDSLVLGHVGRFAEQKNHGFLIDVFEKVNQRVPNSQLVLVGDGPLKAIRMSQVKRRQLENNVLFLGVREDIPDLLQAFDTFVFPSIHEGLPVTLVEAQSAGLPCLISDAITEEVDMDLGLIIRLPLQDKEKWAEEIIRLSQKNHKREVSKSTLIEKGYDIRKTAELTEKRYLSLGGVKG
ncbi:glycosyltransferase family 1 protein [Oceanobacillus halophilus]|uniref:Glycosyltransferase family 1 protein n=1 Tax=Oceanobacillus halophilus TaxID=930130 RepID=A0A495A262_9BACI|nr:glycosyltransferase family 1 protein [Oceanobacillus halophilus]RKQ33503.1 glycosyltransferase family 1 protein [Oceanobacillus halophilus]